MRRPKIAAIRPMAGNARAHLVVPGTPRRDIVAIEAGGCDQLFGKARFARTGAAENEGRTRRNLHHQRPPIAGAGSSIPQGMAAA